MKKRILAAAALLLILAIALPMVLQAAHAAHHGGDCPVCQALEETALRGRCSLLPSTVRDAEAKIAEAPASAVGPGRVCAEYADTHVKMNC